MGIQFETTEKKYFYTARKIIVEHGGQMIVYE